MHDTKYLTEKVLREEPEARADYIYLIAKVWTIEGYKVDNPEFETKFKKLYKYLLNKSHPASILRAKDQFFETNKELKDETLSTGDLIREVQGEQRVFDKPSEHYDQQREMLRTARKTLTKG